MLHYFEFSFSRKVFMENIHIIGNATQLTLGIKGNGLELPQKANKWPTK